MNSPWPTATIASTADATGPAWLLLLLLLLLLLPLPLRLPPLDGKAERRRSCSQRAASSHLHGGKKETMALFYVCTRQTREIDAHEGTHRSSASWCVSLAAPSAYHPASGTPTHWSWRGERKIER